MKINIRKDRMNKYERWQAMMNRQRPDRVPVFSFGLGFSTLYAGLSLVDAYTNPARVIEGNAKTTGDFGWQDLPIIGYAGMGPWELGGEVKMPSGDWAQAPTTIRTPVNSPEDVDNLKVPTDVSQAGMVPLMLEGARLQVEKGFPIIMGMVIGPWQLAANSSGMEMWMKWVLKKPEVAHRFIEKLVPFDTRVIQEFLDIVGKDRLLMWIGGTATTSNQLISPAIFRDFFLPYQKQLNGHAKKAGLKHIFNHICGEQNANLEYWAQLDFGDPGFLSFGHEVELETASEYFPNDVILGNLEPAIIQTGTQEDVYQATRKVLEKGMKLGPHRFMLTPGCELPPRSPIDNIWAMMQAVSDFGWYE